MGTRWWPGCLYCFLNQEAEREREMSEPHGRTFSYLFINVISHSSWVFVVQVNYHYGWIPIRLTINIYHESVQDYTAQGCEPRSIWAQTLGSSLNGLMCQTNSRKRCQAGMHGSLCILTPLGVGGLNDPFTWVSIWYDTVYRMFTL